MKNYFWIIGGGILQIPLIDVIRELGYYPIISDGSSKCFCRDLGCLFFNIDIFDIESHKQYADQLINKGHTISGVLAAGIDAPETMAELARHLGLPCVSPEIARLVYNKDLFRKKMLKMGLPTPGFRVIKMSDVDNLEGIIEEIGFPLIVKNTSSSGSRGTRMFFGPDLLNIKKTVQSAISVSRSKKALIEQVWEGSEHTVETIFDVNGNFHRCFITDRLFDKSNGYLLETGLIHPTQLSKTDQKVMYDLAEMVARELHINIGAAKYDMMITDGGPRIIEMTVRLSGGFDCQYLVPVATGKQILKAAALTALGLPFEKKLIRDTKGLIALSESLWPNQGIIQSISGIEKSKACCYAFWRNYL